MLVSWCRFNTDRLSKESKTEGRETVNCCDRVDMNQGLFLHARAFFPHNRAVSEANLSPLSSKEVSLKRDIEWWGRWPHSTDSWGSRRSDSAHECGSSTWKLEMMDRKKKNTVQKFIALIFLNFTFFVQTGALIKGEYNAFKIKNSNEGGEKHLNQRSDCFVWKVVRRFFFLPARESERSHQDF